MDPRFGGPQPLSLTYPVSGEHHLPAPPDPTRRFRIILWSIVLSVLGAILVVALVLIGLEQSKDAKANVLAIHGHDLPPRRARVDGKDMGLVGPTGLVVELAPGSRTIEIVDASDSIVQSDRVEVPEKGYRGLYVIGEDSGYALVDVGYGRDVRTTTRLEKIASHVYAFPSNRKLKKYVLEGIDSAFPSTVKTRGHASLVITKTCSLDADGEPRCPEAE